MLQARAEHRALKLNDGRVLIVGGRNADSALSSCEIYDPVKNSWKPTGNLLQARYRSQVVKLRDGRIFATGGLTDLNVATTSTCEIYDPVAGSWRFTTSMQDARENHSSALLPDGNVILVGGLDANQPAYLTSCDLFDPATELMKRLPPMLIPQFGEQVYYSVILNGLFVVGGSYGGFSGTWVNTTQILSFYDTTWRNGASSVSPHDAPSVQLPDERVIAPGGRIGSTVFTTLVENFNPVSNTWSTIGNLDQEHWGGAAYLVGNDTVLQFGGSTNSIPSASRIDGCSVVNLKNNLESIGPAMLSPRSAFASILLLQAPDEGHCVTHRDLYVFGGDLSEHSVLASSEKLDLGVADIPPEIQLNVQRVLLPDSTACREVDTGITIFNGGCDSIVLVGIATLDNGIGVHYNSSLLPSSIRQGASSPFPISIIPFFSDTSITSAIQFTFVDRVGDTLRRYVRVNANKPIVPTGLNGPLNLTLATSQCHALDTVVVFRNLGCRNLILHSVLIRGADSSSFVCSLQRDTLLLPGDSIHFHITGAFIAPGLSNVTLILPYTIDGHDLTANVAISCSVATGGKSVAPILMQAPQQAFLGDTVRIPIYMFVKSSITVNGVSLNLSYNTDLLHLIGCEGAGTATANLVSICSDGFGHGTVRIPQAFLVSPLLPITKLVFESFSTNTSCTNLRVDNLSLDQDNGILCQTVGETDSVQICLQQRCGDRMIADLMNHVLNQVTLEPNPAQTVIRLHSGGRTAPFTVRIYDVLGRLWKSFDMSLQNIQIDISTLPEGEYTIVLRTGNLASYKKLSVLR